MSGPARTLVHAFAEYVALEEYSNVRHEFLDGAILPKAGGAPEHAALCAATSGTILQGIVGTHCSVFSSDLRVRVAETGLATYPDVSVVCGPRQTDPEDRNTVVNPRVLVEVTSPSSKDYDRGEKRKQYQRIPTLEEYVIVSHEEYRLDVWRRLDGEWVHTVAGPGESLQLRSIDVSLDVDRLYELAAQSE